MGNIVGLFAFIPHPLLISLTSETSGRFSLHADTMEAPSLEVFKIRLDGAWSNLV